MSQNNLCWGFLAVLKCAATHTNKPLRPEANWTCVSLASQLALDQTSSTADDSCLHSRLLRSAAWVLISRLRTNGEVCKKSNQTPSNLLQNISGNKLRAAIGPLVSSLPTNNKRGLNKAGSKEEDVEVLRIGSLIRRVSLNSD